MNPRQRRGVVLVVLAVLGMIGVFVAVTAFVADVREQVDPKVQVLRLDADARADQPITDDMVEVVDVPEKWAPETALSDPASLLGQVSAMTLPRGTYLQTGMLVPAPEGGRDEREIAILVDAETGVAGRIAAGDLVDILATFPATEDQPQQSRVVVSDARIVAVGLATEVQGETVGGTITTEAVVPVTFALSPREALRVTYAESFAEQVRLGSVRHRDARPFPEDNSVFELGPDGPEFSGEGDG